MSAATPARLHLGATGAAFVLKTDPVDVVDLATSGLIDEVVPGRYSIDSLRRYDANRAAAFCEIDQILADERAVARAVRLLDASLLAELDTVTLDTDPTPPTGIARPVVEDDAK